MCTRRGTIRLRQEAELNSHPSKKSRLRVLDGDGKKTPQWLTSYASYLRRSNCFNQALRWFQLLKIWATILRSPSGRASDSKVRLSGKRFATRPDARVQTLRLRNEERRHSAAVLHGSRFGCRRPSRISQRRANVRIQASIDLGISIWSSSSQTKREPSDSSAI
jgi:hypothetical protein